jgi:hypothetical protein
MASRSKDCRVARAKAELAQGQAIIQRLSQLDVRNKRPPEGANVVCKSHGGAIHALNRSVRTMLRQPKEQVDQSAAV